MVDQPFDDRAFEDEDDTVPFAFSKIRVGVGRRSLSERSLSERSLSCRSIVVAPRVPSSELDSVQESVGSSRPAASDQEEHPVTVPYPAATGDGSEITGEPAAPKHLPDASDDPPQQLAEQVTEPIHIDQVVNHEQESDDATSIKTSSITVGIPKGDGCPAATPAFEARSVPLAIKARKVDNAEDTTNVRDLREFTRSISQRALARTSFRRQGSSLSVTSESGSSVGAEGEVHGTKKKRRSRKIGRSQSMMEATTETPSLSEPAIEYDFEESGIGATGPRRTDDPDGADPVRTPIQRSRSLQRSTSAIFSNRALSKSFHLPEIPRGRQGSPQAAASAERRRSVRRSSSLQPKSRKEVPVPEQHKSMPKAILRTNSSDSLGSNSNRSQVSLKRSDLLSVLSCRLDGSSVPSGNAATPSISIGESDPPLLRTLQRSRSIQPTNRPKMDPPGVLSSASYETPATSNPITGADEEPTDRSTLARAPSIHPKKAPGRKIKRSTSLQPMPRPTPEPIGSVERGPGKSKAKQGKNKRGNGSVTFVESAFAFEFDGVDRTKSSSSASSRTSCSTAGTTTSSSLSNVDYEDYAEGVDAANGAEAKALTA